jgi:hypothetical protein
MRKMGLVCDLKIDYRIRLTNLKTKVYVNY